MCFSACAKFELMRRKMETSGVFLCEYYYGMGYQCLKNGAKRKMRRFLFRNISGLCQMIEICSMNAIVNFLRFQSKIVYRLYIT